MLIVRSSCGYSSTTKVSPSCTVCPSRTRISFTVPARGASTGISIFMDSSTITGSPAATLSPTLAVTWKTTPVMCALISSAMERSLFDHLSVHPAAAEIRVRGDRAEQRQRRLDALDHAGVQCSRQTLDRPGAIGAERDQLEEQRVVVNGDDAALDDARLDPDPLAAAGQRQPRDRTRRGQEILRRVLRVDTHLDGGAALLDLVLRERHRLAGRHAQLRGHQVEAGDFFGDRMLHLEPRVHLEKVEAALRVHQELERARIDVSDGARARDRGVRQPALGLRLEVRRRRLLHELLMTSLDRALTLVQVDDAALRVAEDLDLDVAWRLEIALDVDLGAGFAGGGEDALDAEVRLARRRGPEQHRAIRVLHVGRVAVGLGIDGDGGEPERAAGAEDATRDLPAIGDENGAEHAQGAAETGSVETRSPAAMRQPDAVGVQRSCTNPIARAAGGVAREPIEDDGAGGGVAPLLLETARQDAAGGGLVHGVRAAEVTRVDGHQVRLEHGVDADDALERLPRTPRVLEHLHEGDHCVVRGRRLLRGCPQLGQPPAPEIGVLRAVPDVAAEQQLGGQLGRQRDPAAEHAHHALLGVPVVADPPRGVVDGEVAGEAVRAQYTCERCVLLMSRSISSSVKPASLRASLAIEIGTTSWWPSWRLPPRLKRSSIVSWNSMARRRRSASPRVSSLSQREPMRTCVISSAST